MFASHSWPRFGNERVQEVMRRQRDVYANLYNAELQGAKQGETITIKVEGDDEEAAAAAIQKFLTENV